MKKFIVSGVCTTIVCFLLSSFTPANNVAGTNGVYAGINTPYQDTTHKKSKKTDKTKSDTTSTKTKKADKGKTPGK